MMFFVIRWKRINEFILFNVNVFNLGYHYAWKGVPTLCVSNRMVILLRERWLVGNMKRIYFYHELVVDQFCGRAVTGINPVTSAFYISCCCFEVGVATNEKKDKYRNMLLHMKKDSILVWIKILLLTPFIIYPMYWIYYQVDQILWSKPPQYDLIVNSVHIIY